jgi:hypothetical protein
MHLCLVLALGACADSPSCPRSVTEFCASSSVPCPTTWSAAQDPASWGGCAGRTADNSPLLLESCGDVNVVEMWGVDASTNYYYDASTGQLLTVTSHHAPRDEDTCLGGTPQAVCDDPAPRQLCP